MWVHSETGEILNFVLAYFKLPHVFGINNRLHYKDLLFPTTELQILCKGQKKTQPKKLTTTSGLM